MYAVIESGGKQFRVSQGDVISVEKLCGNVGDTVDLRVILKADGANVVTGQSTAKAEIVAHGKDKKVVVFKYKSKKNIRKKQGHRQQFSKIKILSI